MKLSIVILSEAQQEKTLRGQHVFAWTFGLCVFSFRRFLRLIGFACYYQPLAQRANLYLGCIASGVGLEPFYLRQHLQQKPTETCQG